MKAKKAGNNSVKLATTVGLAGLALGAGGFYFGNSHGVQNGSASGYNNAKSIYTKKYNKQLSKKTSQLTVATKSYSKAESSAKVVSGTTNVVSTMVKSGYTANIVGDHKDAKYQSVVVMPLSSDKYTKDSTIVGMVNNDKLVNLKVVDNSNNTVTVQLVKDTSVTYQFALPNASSASSASSGS